MRSKAEIIVIGAGFAGLSAARALRSKDLIVLEASEHIGGRAWTTRDGQGMAIDRGAQYFGVDHWRLLELIDEFGLRDQMLDYVPGFGPDPVAICDVNARRLVTRRSETYFQLQGLDANAPIGEQLRFLAALAVMEGACRLIDADQPASTALGRYLDTMSFTDYVHSFELVPWFNDLLLSGVCGVWSQDPDRMSALYTLWYMKTNGGFTVIFNDQEDGPQQYGLACGLGGLAERMAKGLDLRLGHGVERVEVGTKGVEVHAAGSVFQCDQLVVATAPRVVADIDFSPPLSPTRQLLARQPGGYAIKALITYDQPWWRQGVGKEDHVFAWLDGRQASGIEWVLDGSPPDRDTYALVVFISPRLVDGLPDDSREARDQAIGQALVELTGREAAADFSACHMTDWRHERGQSGGPNTNFGVGVLTRVRHDWRAPEHGRIHFAAAEYASVYTGYVEGAIASGRAAAAQILGRPVESKRPRWRRRLEAKIRARLEPFI